MYNLADFLLALPTAALLVDERGRVQCVNPPAHKTLDYSPAHMLGLRLDLLIEGFSINHADAWREFCIAGNQEGPGMGLTSVRVRRGSGDVIEMGLSIAKISSISGSPWYYVMLIEKETCIPPQGTESPTHLGLARQTDSELWPLMLFQKEAFYCTSTSGWSVCLASRRRTSPANHWHQSLSAHHCKRC